MNVTTGYPQQAMYVMIDKAKEGHVENKFLGGKKNRSVHEK